jgi:hypothetical protein
MNLGSGVCVDLWVSALAASSVASLRRVFAACLVLHSEQLIRFSIRVRLSRWASDTLLLIPLSCCAVPVLQLTHRHYVIAKPPSPRTEEYRNERMSLEKGHEILSFSELALL